MKKRVVLPLKDKMAIGDALRAASDIVGGYVVFHEGKSDQSVADATGFTVDQVRNVRHQALGKTRDGRQLPDPIAELRRDVGALTERLARLEAELGVKPIAPGAA